MSRFGNLIAAAILGLLVAPASADTIANFTLNGVTFDDGGTATGGFTLDLTTSTLSNVSITTSTDNLLGATYSDGTFSNSPASFDFSTGFLFGETDLYIALSAPLADLDLSSPNNFSLASGSEVVLSLICESIFDPFGICAARLVATGSLNEVPAATPLPSALPLFASGLGVMGLILRRRKSKKTTTVSA